MPHGKNIIISVCLICAFLWLIGPYSRASDDFGVLLQYPCASARSALPVAPTQLDSLIKEKEEELPDGTVRFERSTEADEQLPSLMILTLIKDTTSYGHDEGQPPRSFKDYLEVINSSGLNLNRVALGLGIESSTEFELIKAALTNGSHSNEHYSRLTLVHLSPSTVEITRNDRHKLEPQDQDRRRSYIAQLRNKLTFHSLRSEQHVLWLDADVNYLSRGIIQTMLAHSMNNPAASILTARCQEGPTWDYDKNAWGGFRYPPELGRVNTRQNVAKLIEGTSSNDLIPLTSVGGTILLIRSSLIYRGLVFPAGQVIGRDWEKPGWDGIETEGLCALAKDLQDREDEGPCWVLGGSHYIGHTNF